MPNTIDLYIPCHVLTVRVLVGPSEKLTKLEQLFLRAVLAGMHCLPELVRLFGLGHRPTLDIVFGLWARGYLLIDIVRGEVRAAGHVNSQDLEGLRSAEVVEEERTVMLDGVTGTVFREFGSRRRPEGFDSRSRVIPAEFLRSRVEDVSPENLLVAVRDIIKRENEGYVDRDGTDAPVRRAKQVFGVHLALDKLGRTSQRRWPRISIRCIKSTDVAAPDIRVVDSQYPTAMRNRLRSRLMQILEEFPESEFAEYILSRAEEQYLRLPTMREQIIELEHQTASLSDINIGTMKQRHRELQEFADTIEDARLQRLSAEVEVEVITTQRDHRQWLRDCLRHAERQVCLSLPWITYDALREVYEDLAAALQSGVQVFVLWGFAPHDTLPLPVTNTLLPLKQAFPHHFFIAPTSCTVHGKVAVQDDRRMLVTSLNLLRPSDAGTLELGLAVTAKRECACPPIEAALEFFKETYPDYIAAARIYGYRHQFAPPGTSWSSPAADAALIPKPEIPDATPNFEAAPELREPFVNAWRVRWQRYVKAVKSDGERVVESATLLRDGAHARILETAIRSAQRRLLILSDRIGPEVVNDAFLDEVEHRLLADVAVTVIHRRETRHEQERYESIDRRMADFSQRWPEKFLRMEHEPNHAKILIFDDTVVVTSFNFLSYSGYYRAVKPSLRRKLRSEIGLMISSSRVAKLVIDGVSTIFPLACGHWATCDEAATDIPFTSTPQNASDILGGLEILVRFAAEMALPLDSTSDGGTSTHAEDARKAAFFRRQFQYLGHPYPVLDELRDSQLPDEDLRFAVAAALASASDGSSPEYSRWMNWLAENSFCRRKFIETAVFLANGFGTASRAIPSATMVELMVAWEAGNVTDALRLLSAQPELDVADRSVLAIAAVVGFAIHGSSELQSIAQLAVEELPSPWRPLGDALQEYWSQAYRPLPMDHIEAELSQQNLSAAIDAAWKTLAGQLASAGDASIKFVSGKLTHQWLFHATGSPRLPENFFGHLRRIVEGRLARQTLDRIVADNRHLPSRTSSDTSPLVDWLKALQIESVPAQDRSQLVDWLEAHPSAMPPDHEESRKRLGAWLNCCSTEDPRKPREIPWVNTPEELLDFASEMADSSGRVFKENARTAYLKRMDCVIAAAKKVSALDAPFGDPGEAYVVGLAKDFARVVARHRSALDDHIMSLDKPYRVIVERLVWRVLQVSRWSAAP